MKQKNSKPFKTLNQQLKILRKRGLEVSPSAKRSLEQFGYYSIINGYKWLFLQRNSKGKVIKPEKYVYGSTFDEIHSLYDFDKELRSILYDALLEYESNLGAEISYRFSELHPEEHSYLAMDNYSRDANDISSVVGTISSLSHVIKQKSSRTQSDNAIKHYVNKHGHVPLWVLVNFLTFGDLNYFYHNSTENLKIIIAQDFSDKYKRSYRKPIKISVNSMEAINHLVNHFRNAVAHGEITYSKLLSKGPSFKSIKKDLDINNFNVNSQKGVFELMISLKLVLNKSDYSKLTRRISKLLQNYSEKFASVEFSAILHDMNFPENYRDFLN
ncbi:abortive infection bacteriophage resistance protein [Secundilactobacillus silagincola]|uniref:Abortive infection bacteriophage resistance protein n=1 Tax=Secundilactobacillus silagincola TaxID=1714681 RepID=A0A1Z5J1R4_9LACO|nr:Abi family protein [Secundilactobacillus silagincola]GAX07995.1 abortive infection bacteriophage resistance protein [Secundilactobacillus silagincola]